MLYLPETTGMPRLYLPCPKRDTVSHIAVVSSNVIDTLKCGYNLRYENILNLGEQTLNCCLVYIVLNYSHVSFS